MPVWTVISSQTASATSPWGVIKVSQFLGGEVGWRAYGFEEIVYLNSYIFWLSSYRGLFWKLKWIYYHILYTHAGHTTTTTSSSVWLDACDASQPNMSSPAGSTVAKAESEVRRQRGVGDRDCLLIDELSLHRWLETHFMCIHISYNSHFKSVVSAISRVSFIELFMVRSKTCPLFLYCFSVEED